MKKVPEIVLAAAQKFGLCEMKYIGETDGAQVYGEVGKVALSSRQVCLA